MKSISFKTKTLALAVVSALALNHAFAGKVSELDFAKKELRAVPTAEIPAKAAQLCAQAKPNSATAEAVVSAAVELRPASVVAVVSAIARQNPELAPEVAARAATLRPKEVAAIARAAAGAAPTQAAKIVFAICKALPTKYNVVAVAVAQEVPAAAKEILAAVGSAVPGVKMFVDRASSTAKDSSVASVMMQTDSLVQVAAKAGNSTPEKVITASTPPPAGPAFAALPPPFLGPPFTPLSGTPTDLNRTNTSEIPPGGGRNYSGP
ncbi:MAG: hypothetical protein EXS35_10950 [Pedosphaera sp.]|nr:hypothetical protein [Pedosphaera sp.]